MSVEFDLHLLRKQVSIFSGTPEKLKQKCKLFFLTTEDVSSVFRVPGKLLICTTFT